MERLKELIKFKATLEVCSDELFELFEFVQKLAEDNVRLNQTLNRLANYLNSEIDDSLALGLSKPYCDSTKIAEILGLTYFQEVYKEQLEIQKEKKNDISKVG